MTEIIQVHDLIKTFGDREVIRNCSLSVKGGEIYGFLGANGAGCFLGFLRKSVPVAIVTAVVLCSPVSNFGSPALMAAAMAVAVMIAVVLTVILSSRVNTMEV